MIRSQIYHPVLRALARLIVHAKDKAYQSSGESVADLLNDVELLPEYISDETDRTDECTELLDSIGRMHPDCSYIIEEFNQAAITCSTADDKSSES